MTVYARGKAFIHTHLHLVILGFICLILLLSHTMYVLASRQYPEWDEHQYLSLATSYYDILRSPTIDFYKRILTVSSYRQPLYPLLLTCLLFLFGSEHFYTIALLFNGVLYVTTVFCVYILARKYLDKTPSLMAALIACFYGNALFYLHFTYSETALTTMVTLALTFLAYSDGFTKKRSTILSGIAIGVSWLTKWAGLPFLILPMIAEGSSGIVHFGKEKKKRSTLLKNAMLFTALALLVPICFYYLPNYVPFMEYVSKNQIGGLQWVKTYRIADMANTFSVHSVMYYWNILEQNTIWFFALFVVGTLLAVTHIRRYWFLLVALFSQYFFLTFVSIWKEDRFAVSLYPIMAILSAIVFEHIRFRFLRKFLMSITVGFCFLILLGASWGMGPMGKQGLLDYVTPKWLPHPRRMYLTPLVWPPRTEYANVYQLVDLIIAEGIKKPLVTQLFSNHPWDNAFYSVVMYEKRSLCEYKVFEDTADISQDTFDAIEKNSTYLLIRNETLQEYMVRHKKIGEPPFVLVRKIFVPIDASSVFVYKKDAGN